MHRILHACDSHGLSTSATVVCRSAASSSWYSGRVGQAAAWLVRARDEQRLSAVLEAVVGEVAAALTAAVGSYQVRGGGWGGGGAVSNVESRPRSCEMWQREQQARCSFGKGG